MAREYKIILNRLKRLETLFSLELLTHDSPDNSLYPIFKIQLGIDGLNKKRALISVKTFVKFFPPKVKGLRHRPFPPSFLPLYSFLRICTGKEDISPLVENPSLALEPV